MEELRAVSRETKVGAINSCAAIGMFVVYAGQLERTVGRLVEALASQRDPGTEVSTAKTRWSDLITWLRREAQQSEHADEIERLLVEHRIGDLTALRHNLVHGAVDVTQPPTIAVLRRHLNGERKILLGSVDDLDVFNQHIYDLLTSLKLLIPAAD